MKVFLNNNARFYAYTIQTWQWKTFNQTKLNAEDKFTKKNSLYYNFQKTFSFTQMFQYFLNFICSVCSPSKIPFFQTVFVRKHKKITFLFHCILNGFSTFIYLLNVDKVFRFLWISIAVKFWIFLKWCKLSYKWF